MSKDWNENYCITAYNISKNDNKAANKGMNPLLYELLLNKT
jgi:hypothetical protein